MDPVTDWLKMCRVCGHETKADNTKELFANRINGVLLSEMLQICLQITISNNKTASPFICIKCISNLRIAFEFRKLFMDNNTCLRTQERHCHENNRKEVKIENESYADEITTNAPKEIPISHIMAMNMNRKIEISNNIRKNKATKSRFSRPGRHLLFRKYFKIVSESERKITARCLQCKWNRLIRGIQSSNFIRHLRRVFNLLRLYCPPHNLNLCIDTGTQRAIYCLH